LTVYTANSKHNWRGNCAAPVCRAKLGRTRRDYKSRVLCPQDTVVGLNLSSGVYHFRAQRWYAATKNGAFVCEKEADLAGDRTTENGQ
jgi:hypothetical protein